jgi:hypothetical protein
MKHQGKNEKLEARFHSLLYQEIRSWIESYVRRDEVDGLTNQIHYTAKKHMKSSFIAGFFAGVFFTVIMLKWLS